MPGSVLLVVSYVLLAVFVVAFVVRTIAMARLPVHLRWELTPVPHEKGKNHYGGSYFEDFEWWTKPREKSLVAELVYMFLEIVLLKSVWENNRRLWWFSFPFHFGMYLLIVAVALVLLGGILGVAGVATSGWGLLRIGVPALAGAGYALGGFGALGLLVSRLTDSRLRAFATSAPLFNLALLLAVFASGAYALVVSNGFTAGALELLQALLTADSAVESSAVLVVHQVLIFLFLAYLPFTPMMHFVAKYFTYHKVRWDDEPLVPGGPMEKEVLELLNQKVTWSGPHLKADGKKNWVDIATEEASK